VYAGETHLLHGSKHIYWWVRGGKVFDFLVNSCFNCKEHQGAAVILSLWHFGTGRVILVLGLVGSSWLSMHKGIDKGRRCVGVCTANDFPSVIG